MNSAAASFSLEELSPSSSATELTTDRLGTTADTTDVASPLCRDNALVRLTGFRSTLPALSRRSADDAVESRRPGGRDGVPLPSLPAPPPLPAAPLPPAALAVTASALLGPSPSSPFRSLTPAPLSSCTSLRATPLSTLLALPVRALPRADDGATAEPLTTSTAVDRRDVDARAWSPLALDLTDAAIDTLRLATGAAAAAVD